MFQLEYAFGPDGFVDDLQHAWLIIWMNIFLKPCAGWRLALGDKLSTTKLAHLAPIRAHTKYGVRSGRNQSAEALFALAQRLLG